MPHLQLRLSPERRPGWTSTHARRYPTAGAADLFFAPSDGAAAAKVLVVRRNGRFL